MVSKLEEEGNQLIFEVNESDLKKNALEINFEVYRIGEDPLSGGKFGGKHGDFAGVYTWGADLVGSKHGGRKFEKGGARGSGSGGEPGLLAGNGKFGEETTTYGGFNREREKFVKDGSEASWS